jgi:hypothetical protein
MKQIIILCSMIMVGILIYNLISGNQEGSVLSSVKSVWLNELELQKKYP